MIRVIIESPYAGDRERNARYLNHIMLDCLKRGEAPIASHKLYTDILDDNTPDERDLGIEAGLAWSVAAQKVIVGVDLGVSGGMYRGIARHIENKVEIEYRSYGDWVRSEDICEVCGVCIEPAPRRCELHAYTEPGDPEWTYENKE